jgi:SHS2 domain-containing protein
VLLLGLDRRLADVLLHGATRSSRFLGFPSRGPRIISACPRGINSDGRARAGPLIEHTADIGFELDAPDAASLFARAALALHDIVADPRAARPAVERPIDVSGHDREDALVRALEEALFIFEVEGTILCEADLEVREDPASVHVRGVVRGERFDPARHELRRPVKAVTYHDILCAPDERGTWRARVILDL